MTVRVEVVRAWPRRHRSVALDLSEGATVADAIAVCGLPLEGVTDQAVFGERAAPSQVLRHGDRIELLAPLLVDPKEARRRRAVAPKR